MSSRNILLLGILNLLLASAVQAQSEEELLVEQIVEALAENAAEDADYSELVERLHFYRRHPINLNNTTVSELQELTFLSPLQITQLLTYLKENGELIELMELQAVEGFDSETIARLLPFVTIQPRFGLKHLTLKNLISKGRHDLIFTYGKVLERQAGFRIPDTSSRSRYLGSPHRLLTRYRYNLGKELKLSLNMEKDAGEGLFSSSQPRGFDFYSGSLSIKKAGRLKEMVLGDYSLQFGQGLSLWSGFGFGKGAAVTSIVKNPAGLRSYTSTNESQFMRGAAATVVIKKLELTPFFSLRYLDGSISSDSAISSVSVSGLHRTSNELDIRRSFRQTSYGLASQLMLSGLRIGATFSRTVLDKPFEAGKNEYDKFSFDGDKLSNLGLNYSYNFRNIYLFGETAHSIGEGTATVNGALLSLTSNVSFIALHRDYSRRYFSFYNQALSEATEAVNERGFYSGLVLNPNRRLEIATYADFYRFPWLRFRADAPSTGFEILSQLSYAPSKRLKAVLRYKFEQKEENDDLPNSLNFLEKVVKENARLELNYRISKDLQLRNRAEAVSYSKGKSGRQLGFLAFQDVNYRSMESRLSGSFRFAIFNTDGFDTRIYSFENDVLYGFSAPAYQHRGTRFYLNGRYRMVKGLDFWMRYSLTTYSNLESIGSGLEEIEGNKKSDIKLQLRYQF
ncbi:helix-hairpin-helix domain-containing protein [Pedobacter sp. SYSU D00535]|uniref:helix-hairpin-helix domain-containing protein n=1 Tax=Pedobacter sp. SYSU D00535 TaxID=2810308 RepID=UPI001A9758DE|nr:helix-hairpin-helix domain-containing protein [Pedobacter sp. SYSU D00535]